MRFDDEPEPSGERSVPPPRIRVALDQLGDAGKPAVLIVVSDVREETLLVKSAEMRGWDVHFGEDVTAAIVTPMETVRIVITDDFDLIRTVNQLSNLSTKPVLVALISWHEAALHEAKKAGADAVLQRPLNEKDPLVPWEM